jgi:hypothetical protein
MFQREIFMHRDLKGLGKVFENWELLQTLIVSGVVRHASWNS